MVVVTYLRSKADLKTKTGVLEGKVSQISHQTRDILSRLQSSNLLTLDRHFKPQRHDYFKGKAAVKALLSPSYAKIHPATLQKVTDESSAAHLLHSIIPYAFFLRVDRSTQSIAGAKYLQMNPNQLFNPEEYYAWLYDGNQLAVIAGAALMVAVILAGVMFPLWPISMRIGVWYLSIAALGFVGLFFGIAIVRLFLYVITYFAASPGIWLFPNLFEDVGFVELISYSSLFSTSKYHIGHTKLNIVTPTLVLTVSRSTLSFHSGAGTFLPRKR